MIIKCTNDVLGNLLQQIVDDVSWIQYIVYLPPSSVVRAMINTAYISQ